MSEEHQQEDQQQQQGGWFADELSGVAQTEEEKKAKAGQQQDSEGIENGEQSSKKPASLKKKGGEGKKTIVKKRKRPPQQPPLQPGLVAGEGGLPTTVSSDPATTGANGTSAAGVDNTNRTPDTTDKAQWGILGMEFQAGDEEQDQEGEDDDENGADEEEEYYEEEEEVEEEEEEEDGPSFLELAEQAAARPGEKQTTDHVRVAFPLKNRAQRPEASAGPDPNDRWGALLGRGPSAPARFYYSIKIWTQAKDNLRGILSVEKMLETFLVDETDKATTMLPAMPKEKRALVHEMCWYYHITSEAVDREPNRSCYLTKTADSAIPSKRLSDAIADPYQDPNEIASKTLRNPKEAMSKTIVIDGDRLNEIYVAGLLKPFAGQMIVVPHETKEFTFFLVFPWGKEMNTAYTFLRRLDPSQIANIHYFRFGDDPHGAGSGGGYKSSGSNESSSTSFSASGAGGGDSQQQQKKKKAWSSFAEESSRKKQQKEQKNKSNSTLDVRNAFGALGQKQGKK